MSKRKSDKNDAPAPSSVEEEKDSYKTRLIEFFVTTYGWRTFLAATAKEEPPLPG